MLFQKLYGKLFYMEDQKYLPPKYSYALRDLATDYGIFEKFETQSMRSGASSTNISIKTMSAFNVSLKDAPLYMP